jgi:hypothetical protein
MVQILCRRSSVFCDCDSGKFQLYDVRENIMDNSIVVKKIIFHDPATIVYWGDGTKTVVKCMKGDTFNPELGMAMCMLKRMLDPPSYTRYKKLTQEYVNGYLEKQKKKMMKKLKESSFINVDSNLNYEYENPLKALIDLVKGTK